MEEIDKEDRYNQGFSDYYNHGDGSDSRFDDCEAYQAGYMAAMVRCQKPFEGEGLIPPPPSLLELLL